MADELRAAVVGLGIGKTHAREYAARDDVDLVALVDRSAEALDSAATLCPATTYTDLATMLREARPDVVSLATPPHLHAEQTAACVAAGTHVLVEKPLAPTAEHCRRICEVADGTDRVIMVAQKKRFTEPVRLLREKFAGEWGRPQVTSVRYWLGRVEKDWFWQEEEGGGPLVENAVHACDLLRVLVGEVRRVYAAGGNVFMTHRAPTPDVACATLEFVDGAVASLAIGYGSEWGFNDEQWGFATEKVTVTLSGPFDRPAECRWIARGERGEGQHRHFADGGGFRQEIDAFIQAVRAGGPSPVPVADAAKSIKLCLALKESLRTGTIVTL